MRVAASPGTEAPPALDRAHGAVESQASACEWRLLSEVCVVDRHRQLLLDAVHGFLGQLRFDLLFDFRPRFLEAFGDVLLDLDNVIPERRFHWLADLSH